MGDGCSYLRIVDLGIIAVLNLCVSMSVFVNWLVYALYDIEYLLIDFLKKFHKIKS